MKNLIDRYSPLLVGLSMVFLITLPSTVEARACVSSDNDIKTAKASCTKELKCPDNKALRCKQKLNGKIKCFCKKKK